MSKPCKFCGGTDHTAFYCRKKPRTAIKRSPLKSSRKPIRQIGKHGKLWIEARNLWIKLNGSEGHVCHYCGKPLTIIRELIEQGVARFLTLDHLDARSREPRKRYDQKNLVPACPPCNKMKGSLSHSEFKHHCHSPLPA